MATYSTPEENDNTPEDEVHLYSGPSVLEEQN